ncbi:MAG: ABC transporter permease [Methylococcaceae bacterium]|nr:ABC transporter permease [Methylococcaceae bacterium]
MRHLIAFNTILGKEIYRFMRIWPQTVLPAAVTTSLYFLIFGTLIGNRIGPMDGISYMDYIVPGVALMSVITNSYSNVVSSVYSSKFQRNIEELLTSPVPNWIILTGYVGGGVVRGLTVGAVVTGIGMLFSTLTFLHPLVIMGVFILTASLFALAGFINAVYANSFDDISIVPNFVLTPLVYLGGVFYSINLLPEFWQKVSLGNPVLYMVNAFRYGFLGVSDIPVGPALGVISLVVLILIGWALWLLRRGTGLKS